MTGGRHKRQVRFFALVLLLVLLYAVTEGSRPRLAISSSQSVREETSINICNGVHPVTCRILQGERLFVLQFAEATSRLGLGAQIGIVLTLRAYYEPRYLVVDESLSPNYRFNNSLGLLQGFFERTGFDVVDFHAVVKPELQARNFSWQRVPYADSNNNNDNSQIVKVSVSTQKKPWEHFLRTLKQGNRFLCPTKPCPLSTLKARTDLFCDSLQLQPWVQTRIHSLLSTIPNQMNVGCHIRRGDKVARHEAETIPAIDYVKYLLGTLPKAQVENCFVATDEPGVVIPELESTLVVQGVPCRLHHLSGWNKEDTLFSSLWNRRSSVDDTLLVLAELVALQRADVFVGTFSSALGRLLALWRGCPPNNRSLETLHDSHSVHPEDWSP